MGGFRMTTLYKIGSGCSSATTPTDRAFKAQSFDNFSAPIGLYFGVTPQAQASALVVARLD